MLENKDGQKIPQVTFKIHQNNKLVDITTDQLFANKTVIVFSLPGAYTPTCSNAHVPRYNELAGVFKSNQVDDIVCISVNDTFVMNAWQQDQHAENITFIPDGNTDFTQGMGMLVDKHDLGFGKRSWRYSMLVKNQVIEKMFIEENVPGDPYEVSDADTMLNYINPSAQQPEFITLFTKAGCSHCTRAKNALNHHGLTYEDVELDKDITTRSLRAVSGVSTTPQIFIGGKLIGTADDLDSYLKQNHV